jgi:hypothetical protein
MSKANDFRLYAGEAMRWARQSKSEKEGLALVEIAQTWLRAAAMREGVLFIDVHPPEAPEARAA